MNLRMRAPGILFTGSLFPAGQVFPDQAVVRPPEIARDAGGEHLVGPRQEGFDEGRRIGLQALGLADQRQPALFIALHERGVYQLVHRGIAVGVDV